MEPRFSGISLRNISKQLNTEISVLLHDLKQIKQKLNKDILAVIQQICKETVDVDLSSHDETKLNLCHLIGLMITYECCIVLRNILSADPTPSVDCDFDVIGFFERQLKVNRTHFLCKDQDQTQMLDHTIDRCREQSPIILLCDHRLEGIFDSNHSMPSNSSSSHCDCHCVESKMEGIRSINDFKTQSLTNSEQSAVNTIRFDLSMINSKIYTKCKQQRNRRCPLRDIPLLNRSISSITSIPSISSLPRLQTDALSRSPSIGTMPRCASSSRNTPKSEPTLSSHAPSARRTKVLNSKYRSAPNLSKLGEIGSLSSRSSSDKLEVRSKSENDLKEKRRRVRIPKSSLSPFADKNYHQFGRRHHLPIYSVEEIAKHRAIDDCWIIVDNLVLDVTAFLPYHPASYECILRKSGGGQVCDLDFKFHSKSAQNLFWKFVIGRVQRETSCIVM